MTYIRKKMNPIEIIEKYYSPGSRIYDVLLSHSKLVAEKAVKIVQNHPELQADETFVWEAALLHDIGIFGTYAPEIACTGDLPYICHGIFGSELLQKEGLPRHARVCERHTGAGLSRESIAAQNLPLPLRDMLPVSIEEQIICFADKFYSKSQPGKELKLDKIRAKMSRYDSDSIHRFDRWCRLFLP